jgi:hypothetical protein
VFDEMSGLGGVITQAGGINTASIWCESHCSGRLNKHREYCGGTLKLATRLHLLITHSSLKNGVQQATDGQNVIVTEEPRVAAGLFFLCPIWAM